MDARMGKTAGGLAKGAAVLGAAAIVSKLLGTLQKIPLQNIAGDEVFGLYHAVYPLYILILTLATAGVPVAVSAFVLRYAASGDLAQARRVLRMAVVTVGLTGVLGFAGLYAAAETIARVIGMPQAALAVRSVSFALLVSPVMAAYRGYYQGFQRMVPTAVSQVAEQTVRVAVMIALLLWLTERGSGAESLAAGATFGSVAGAVAGLGVMLIYRWRDRHQTDEGTVSRLEPEPLGRLFRKFAAYAIPVCLGAMALPVLTIVDTLTLPRLILADGATSGEAARLFGLYNHGLPLVQLLTMVATSLAAAIVPAIADAKSRGDGALLMARIRPTLEWTWLVGLGGSVGLVVTAYPVSVMLYADSVGWDTMAILGASALFGTLQVVIGSILQGLGEANIPAASMFLAAGVKLAGNLLLVPVWGINGAAVALILAYGTAAAVNGFVLNRTLASGKPAEGSASLGRLVRSLGAAVMMGALVLGLVWGLEALSARIAPGMLSYRAKHSLISLLAVGTGAAVYLAALVRFKAIDDRLVQMFPGATGKWRPLFAKLKLIDQEVSQS